MRWSVATRTPVIGRRYPHIRSPVQSTSDIELSLLAKHPSVPEGATTWSLSLEIVDYFHSLGARVWVVILTPLLAGLVLAGIAFHLNYNYKVNALIDSPTLTGVRSAESDGNQYSTELQSVLQDEIAKPAVLAEISHRTGVPVAKLKAGLSVGRLKPSSFAVISYSSIGAKNVTKVVRAAADVAYGELISYEQRVSRAPLDAAEARLALAEQAIVSLAQQSRAPDPTTAYIVARYEVARLESALAQHLANGNQVAASQDQVALTVSRQQQASLVNAVGTHLELVVQRDQARTARDVAYQRYIKAQNRIDASDPATAVHIGVPKRQIPVKDMTILGGAAGGIALALVLLIQWVSESRRWMRIRGSNPTLATA
jgi:hypothetical protein